MNQIHPQLVSLAVPIGSLVSLDTNPRKGDIESVKRSYERFGQRKPIVARSDTRQVLAGNHQLAAARALGWKKIAVLFVDDDEATAAAYTVADNRTGMLGDWDVANLLATLDHVDADLLDVVGFSTDDMDDFRAILEESIPTASTSRIDENTGLGPSVSYDDFLERYAARTTRALIFEYPITEHTYLVEQLDAYRTASGIETNAEALLALIAAATNTTPPTPEEHPDEPA